MTKKIPIDHILEISGIEHRNVQKNIGRLDEYLPVYNALIRTVSSIFPLLQKALLKEKGELRYVAITNLYALMMQDVLKAMVNFTRGYITDASFEARRILESAAISIEMYKKPKKVKYYTSFETDKDRDKYIENFKVFIIVQNTLSEEAQNEYKRLCFSVHPSALAVGGRTTMNEKLEHSIEFIEYVEEKDTPRLRMHYMVLMLTIYLGFRDLAFPFKEDTDFLWDKADSLLSEFQTTWIAYRTKLINEHPDLLEDIL